MRFLIRSMLPATAFLGLVASFSVPDPGVGPRPEDARAAAERTAALRRVINARYEAVDELLEGRQSFAATAARFQALASEDPGGDVATYLRKIYPEYAQDDDVYYLHVVFYVDARLRDRGQDDLSLVKQLRSELDRRRDQRAPAPTAPQ
jgi:hypothetical protein